jgi:hypothetical protein
MEHTLHPARALFKATEQINRQKGGARKRDVGRKAEEWVKVESLWRGKGERKFCLKVRRLRPLVLLVRVEGNWRL